MTKFEAMIKAYGEDETWCAWDKFADLHSGDHTENLSEEQLIDIFEEEIAEIIDHG